MKNIIFTALFLLLSNVSAYELFPQGLTIGKDFSLAGMNGVNSTILKINGGIVLKQGITGPNYGDGNCGIAYRDTQGETNMSPSLVFRCNTYMFEGDADIANGGPYYFGWPFIINDTGVCAGCNPIDIPAPYPVERLTVRRGDIGFQALQHHETNTIIWRDINGVPIWRAGVFKGNKNFRILKLKDKKWTVEFELEY